MNLDRYDYKIIFVDVGQGDATFIINNSTSECVLIDAGDRKKVCNILKKFGKLNSIFLTHWDSDHIRGIPNIIEWLTKRNQKVSILVNIQLADSKIAKRLRRTLDLAEEEGIIEIEDAYIKKEPKVINKIGGEFTILWPTYKNLITKPEDRNFNSLIMRFKAGIVKLLLCGDADGSVWSKIDHSLIEADILKYPHHGAKLKEKEIDWSAKELIEHVKPKWIIVSVGQKNQYCHPSEEFIEAESEYNNINFLYTSDNGTIEIIIDILVGKIELESS